MVFRAVSFNDDAKRRVEEASKFEKKLRLEAWLNIPQLVGPFELRHITPRDILNLEFSENRIALGEEPKLDDYVYLVWSLSNKNRFFKTRQIRKIADEIRDSAFVKEEILSFYASSLNDLPSSGKNDTVSPEYQSSVYICSLIDSLADSYGWSLVEILDTPLSVCLQLLQRALKRNLGDKYSIRNAITQRAKAYELNRLNKNG